MSRTATQLRKALDAASVTAAQLERDAERRHHLAELAIDRARRADYLADQAQATVRELTAALKHLA